MIYRKLKRTWAHNDARYIPGFKETFPELNNLSSEELCERWLVLGVDFYTEKQKPVKWYIRLTLPIAMLVWLGMFITLPIHFILYGTWGYSLGKNNYIYNWFSQLHLI